MFETVASHRYLYCLGTFYITSSSQGVGWRTYVSFHRRNIIKQHFNNKKKSHSQSILHIPVRPISSKLYRWKFHETTTIHFRQMLRATHSLIWEKPEVRELQDTIKNRRNNSCKKKKNGHKLNDSVAKACDFLLKTYWSCNCQQQLAKKLVKKYFAKLIRGAFFFTCLSLLNRISLTVIFYFLKDTYNGCKILVITSFVQKNAFGATGCASLTYFY